MRWPFDSPARRALTLTLASFLMWSLFALVRLQSHPFADLNHCCFTDHFSHLNAARAFPQLGTRIWRVPIAELLTPLALDDAPEVPEDIRSTAAKLYKGGLYDVPGWRGSKPYASSWTNKPRLYPPGDMVLVAPIAALYHFTPISFSHTNLILILLYLAYAHVTIYLLFCRPPPLLTVVLVYLAIIHWTLEGFYDAAAIAPLILCARALEEKRPAHAILAFCVAGFVHFRSFFFAPWVLVAAIMFLTRGHWRHPRRDDLVSLAAAAVLGGIALYVFALLWPTLRALPIKNYIGWREPQRSLLAAFALVSLASAVALVAARAWVDVAVLAWLCLMMVSLREAYAWHFVIAVLPWLAAPVFSRTASRAPLVHTARLGFALFVTPLVFHDGLDLVPLWLTKLFT